MSCRDVCVPRTESHVGCCMIVVCYFIMQLLHILCSVSLSLSLSLSLPQPFTSRIRSSRASPSCHPQLYNSLNTQPVNTFHAKIFGKQFVQFIFPCFYLNQRFRDWLLPPSTDKMPTLLGPRASPCLWTLEPA
jgi:hypothetical protein